MAASYRSTHVVCTSNFKDTIFHLRRTVQEELFHLYSNMIKTAPYFSSSSTSCGHLMPSDEFHHILQYGLNYRYPHIYP
jgi:hypothetical protein